MSGCRTSIQQDICFLQNGIRIAVKKIYPVFISLCLAEGDPPCCQDLISCLFMVSCRMGSALLSRFDLVFISLCLAEWDPPCCQDLISCLFMVSCRMGSALLSRFDRVFISLCLAEWDQLCCQDLILYLFFWTNLMKKWTACSQNM